MAKVKDLKFKNILLYGFIIGLALIGLGFGLKYKELSKGEQKNIVSMLSKELDGNISVIGELKQNTKTFLNQQLTISQSLRTKGIKILPVMFPEENLTLINLLTQMNWRGKHF